MDCSALANDANESGVLREAGGEDSGGLGEEKARYGVLSTLEIEQAQELEEAELLSLLYNGG